MIKKLFVISFVVFPIILFSQSDNSLPKSIKGNWFDINKSNVWRYGFYDGVIYANGQFLHDYHVTSTNKETKVKFNNDEEILITKIGINKISITQNSKTLLLSKRKANNQKYIPKTDIWAGYHDFLPDTIVIQGLIKDYHKLKSPPLRIELTIRQIQRSKWIEKKLKVNKHGVFYFKHYLTEPMVAVHIGNAANTFLASPGDTISMYIDPSFNWEAIKLLAFKNELDCEFGGFGVGKSIEYNHYLPTEMRGLIRENSLEKERKELTPYEYLAKNRELMEKQLLKAKKYFKKNSSSKYFESYVYSDIIYGAMYEVLKSKMYSIKDIAERDSFFYQTTNYTKRLYDFSDKPTYCESFRSYVNREIDYKYSSVRTVPLEDLKKYIMLEQVADSDKEFVQHVLKGAYDKILIEIFVFEENDLPEVDSFVVRNPDYIKTILNYCQLQKGLTEIQNMYSKSQATDYMINYISTMRFHYRKDTIPPELLFMMSELTDNDQLITHIQNENDKLKKLLVGLSNMETVKLEDNIILNDTSKIISNLLAKYPDKPIYIDFWATWCAPCRKELEKSKYIHNLFKDDLEFVYICCKSNRKEFEVLTKEYGLQGKHFFVSDNKQVKELLTFFKTRGFPTYLIIDRKGIVGYAPRPSNTKGLKEMITNINGG